LLERDPGPTVRAILLDALGTLIELEPPAPFLRAELAARFGVRLSATESEQAIAAEIAYYRQHFDEGRDETSLAHLRERCARALREAIPEREARRLPPAGGLLDALLASLRFRPYPDAGPALDDYRARGLRTVVVSNWDVSLHAVLRRLGVTPMVDGVVTSAEAGARKPAPAIFELALELAGVPARDAVHVGNSLDEDVAGAQAAGIEPVWVNRDGIPGADGVRTIASLAEPIGWGESKGPRSGRGRAG
jgi:putative hydrolase of the HAD superfamily